MSGDLVVLRGGTDGNIESLVRAAGLVVDHAGVRTAIIGGLAVTCRLATAHRATGDVDIVADDPSVVAATPSAAENLVAAGVATREQGVSTVRVHVGNTKVEIIETSSVDAAEVADIEPELSRLFLLAHRWALDTATSCRIAVTGTDLEVEVPVATPAALVAMKLHALQDRNDDRKRASDAWDLYRLIDAHGRPGGAIGQLAGAPEILREMVAAAVDRLFRSEATRTRRWIQSYGAPEWAGQATEDALGDAAGDFDAAVI